MAEVTRLDRSGAWDLEQQTQGPLTHYYPAVNFHIVLDGFY